MIALAKPFYALLQYFYSGQTLHNALQTKRKQKKDKVPKVLNIRFDLNEPSLPRIKRWKTLGFNSEESYNSFLFHEKIRCLSYYFFLAIVCSLTIFGIAIYYTDTKMTTNEYRTIQASKYPLTDTTERYPYKDDRTMLHKWQQTTDHNFNTT